MKKAKIVIIGGGASGIIAGITAARLGAKVTILERKDRIGRKILATGNGRCNLTNRHITASHYFNKKNEQAFLNHIFKQFTVKNTIEFFNHLGIEINEKEEGKLYPRADQASAVLSVLLLELERLKVNMICDQEVEKIEIDQNIRVFTQNSKYYCDKIILASGGKSCPNLGSNGSGYTLATSLGHSIVPTFPSLVQLKTDYLYLKHLQGTKAIGRVKLLDENKEFIQEEKGEILFTDYGISGPPVLQISRQASYRLINQNYTYVLIDLIPEYNIDDLDELLTHRFSRMPTKEAKDSLIGLINNRFIMPILRQSEIELSKRAGDITKAERMKLSFYLKNIKMKVIGTKDYNHSQVTGGGIKLDEINPKSLLSKKVPNLYLCGEVLDVDGICGGYNLQWAWSSGYVAGKNAVLEEQK